MAISDQLTAINNAKTAIKNAIEAKGVSVGSAPLSDYASKIAAIPTGSGSSSSSSNPKWLRNPDWPALPTVTSSDHKMVGLYAVWPEGSNYLALTAAGAYTVNVGLGGSNVSQAADTTFYYEYNYSDSALVGTEKPVNLVTSTNLVTRTAHGKKNGDFVSLFNLSASVGVEVGVQYYVINATTDNFQISKTQGGAAVTFSANATASLLPYRVAVVTVQATSTLTRLNLDVRHTAIAVSVYNTGWLDIAMAGTLTTLTTTVTTSVRFDWVEQLQIFNTAKTSLASLCNTWVGLKCLKIWNSASNTSLDSVCFGCFSLKEVYIKDSASVTTFNQAFAQCTSLEEGIALDTSSATILSNMYLYCYSMKISPAYNAPLATTISGMFNSCNNLKYIPNLTLGNPLTTIATAFRYCYSLQSLKITYTGSSTSVITATNVMQDCNSLTSLILQGWKSTIAVNQQRLSAAALNALYTSLGTAISGGTITVTNNYGAAAATPSIATAKGWTVTN